MGWVLGHVLEFESATGVSPRRGVCITQSAAALRAMQTAVPQRIDSLPYPSASRRLAPKV